jgi:hypothetical protein
LAEIVLGIGTSHSPLLALDAPSWFERARDDQRNQRLNLSDGRYLSYDQLAKEVGDKYAKVATLEHFRTQEKTCLDAIDRAAQELAEAKPDVAIVVGDDQAELFSLGNMPAISVFYGDNVVTHRRHLDDESPGWLHKVAAGYAVDANHSFPGEPKLALELINGLIERDVDIGASDRVEDPAKAGFGHAYGFVYKRLFGPRPVPMVPILLNTYYPPNVPKPKRCYEIGQYVREIVEKSPSKQRVAIIASGGLSHFTVDEKLDRDILDAFTSGRPEKLKELPTPALNAGASEIRNWIVAAGALEKLKAKWTVYEPVYRTPAGTGIGLAFAVWR